MHFGLKQLGASGFVLRIEPEFDCCLKNLITTLGTDDGSDRSAEDSGLTFLQRAVLKIQREILP